MVSLKSRVSAILCSLLRQLLFPPFVIHPCTTRCCYRKALALLGAATEQDDQCFAILAKIHAITRSEINAVFKYAAANAFYIGEIALFHAVKRHGDFSRSV